MPIGGTVQRIGGWIMTRGYMGMMAGVYTDGRAFYIMDDYGNAVMGNNQWVDWATEAYYHDAVAEVWTLV